jgi:hypothetical protein
LDGEKAGKDGSENKHQNGDGPTQGKRYKIHFTKSSGAAFITSLEHPLGHDEPCEPCEWRRDARQPKSAVLYASAPPGDTIVNQSSKNGPARKVKICQVGRSLMVSTVALIQD